MLKKIDFKFLLLSIASITISVLTMHGIIQKFIHFADPLNEIVFCFMTMFTGLVMLLGAKK